MTKEEYESKYLKNLPTFTEVNGVLEKLLQDSGKVNLKHVFKYEGRNGVIMSYDSHSVHNRDNSFLVLLADDVDPELITDEELSLITDDIIAAKLQKVNAIYSDALQKFEEMGKLLNGYVESVITFPGDKYELLNELKKSGMHCELHGRSGFDCRNEYRVYPNDSVCEKIEHAESVYKNYLKTQAPYLSRQSVERAMQIISEDIPQHGEEWLKSAKDVYDSVKSVVDDRNHRRQMFKKAQACFDADEYQLIELLKKIDGLDLERTGNSVFDSRNTVTINMIPEVNEDKDDIPLDKINEQEILSNAVYNWATKQLDVQKEQDFVTAFNTNKKGIVGFVSEGGHNRDYIVPDNYKCILSVKTANTKDHRQHLTHTYNNLYIDTSKLSDVKGVLHIDLPEEYIGMFIGKSGSHINQIISDLQEINPNIRTIKCHPKELSLVEPDFSLSNVVPEHISKEAVLKDYFDKYATEEERNKYYQLVGSSRMPSTKRTSQRGHEFDDIVNQDDDMQEGLGE